MSHPQSEHDKIKSLLSELLEVTKGYKEYIDAIPDDVVAKLPAMPGICGEWADEVVHTAEQKIKEKE